MCTQCLLGNNRLLSSNVFITFQEDKFGIDGEFFLAHLHTTLLERSWFMFVAYEAGYHELFADMKPDGESHKKILKYGSQQNYHCVII